MLVGNLLCLGLVIFEIPYAIPAVLANEKTPPVTADTPIL